jgi:hypothetical protein
MIKGQVNLENVSKDGKPPMRQSKNPELMCEIMYAMFEQVMIMLMGIFGQTVWGSANMHIAQTVLSVRQQWVAY